MLWASTDWITASSGTSQKSDSFSRRLRDSGRSERQTRTSGWMPIPLSSLTLCCVGFVLSSPAPRRKGISDTWMYITFSSPTWNLNWRMASRNGRLSMSPTVPPTSTTMISAPCVRATRVISSRISLVT